MRACISAYITQSTVVEAKLAIDCTPNTEGKTTTKHILRRQEEWIPMKSRILASHDDMARNRSKVGEDEMRNKDNQKGD